MGCLNCKNNFFLFLSSISQICVVDFLKKLECQMRNEETVGGDTDMSSSG